MKKDLILHPFLFAIFIVLAPLAHNIIDVRFAGLRALLITVAASIVIVIFARLIIHDTVRAALVSSGIIILVFSYGHVESLIEDFISGNSVIGEAIILPIWIILFVLWTFWVTKQLKSPAALSRYLNAVSLLLVIFPIYRIISYTRNSSVINPYASEYQVITWKDNDLVQIQSIRKAQAVNSLPDIYYIILDGYTRADILEELYGYDNSDFVSFLEDRDFYVANESRSNYTDTVFSISSALNMMHINTLPEYIQQNHGSSDFGTLKDASSVLIQDNRISSFLKQQGYKIITFDSGYDRIKVKISDQYLRSPNIEASNMQAAFDLMLLDSSIGRTFFRHFRGEDFSPYQSLFNDHRERILFTFRHLADFAELDGNYFIFAHILSPHSPYVFGPNGEERNAVDPYTLLDSETDYRWSPDLYRDQVIYINKLAKVTIDQILEKSDVPPIIILQADHSSRSYRQKDEDTKMKLLFPILNAYHLPNVDQSSLYSTITPVNSFRIVLNSYFGSDLNLAADTSYLLEDAGGKSIFIEACRESNICSLGRN